MARLDPSAPLRLEELETRENPAPLPGTETFDSVTPPALPAGWVEWSSDGIDSVSITAGSGLNSTQAAVAKGTSTSLAFTWKAQAVNADTAASVSVYADSLVPAMVIARGQNLGTSTPSYLAAVVTRGLTVELWQVTNGQITVLGSLTSPSSSYLSGKWVKVSIVPNGDTASITVTRQDTGQYLNAQGVWETAAATALSATVAAPTGDGAVGFGRAARYAGSVRFDDFDAIPKAGPVSPPPVSPPPAPPPSVPSISQDFNSATVGAIPDAWSTWSSSPNAAFQTAAPRTGVPTNALASNSPTISNAASRAWANVNLGADVDVAASVYLDSLISAQIFARGTNLDTATPTYYAVNITRGLQATIVKVQNGVSTTLETIRSTSYISGQWARVHLIVEGDHLRVTITRQDTGQYLQANGTWGSTPDYALDVHDSSLTANGLTGVARAASVAGTVTFDDFEARSLEIPPAIAVQAVGDLNGSGFAGSLNFQTATFAGSAPISSVEFKLDGVSRYVANSGNAAWTLDTTTLANGTYTLTARVFDSAGRSAAAELQFTVNNAPADPTPLPTAPRHYDHIRIAMLAYSGNPMGAYEKALLQSSVDLVVANPIYLSTIDSTSPNTPQLVYTNLSNLYGGLLTDWLNYADAHGVSREDAFFHVTQATPWTGDSPSSQPVNWFWSVVRTGVNGSTDTDFTRTSRGLTTTTMNFGVAGQTMRIAYPDKFREINLDLTRGAAAGWSGVWEYATTNAQGQTVWKTLSLVSDGTAGLTRTGSNTITFDPPADWVATANTAGAAKQYQVRFRVTSGASSTLAPIAKSIVGRDYVKANGGKSGTIPAFDFAADSNGDGYLSDTEYSQRSAGMDARFVYESRLFYPYYGQMRFVTNPSSPAVAAWAAEYHVRLLSGLPQADGLFIDNSSGKLYREGAVVREATAAFSTDYAALVDAVNRAVSPKWVVSNTVGGAALADATTAASSASYEEFLLRPLITNWSEFNDVVNIVNRRLAAEGSPYLIMDSSYQGGSPTDGRTQISTLAYYYLLGDPDRTFLMFYGGNNPASTWTNHWSPAVEVDIGKPVGAFTTIATGADPTNSALTYKVFAREYTDGLVLYKPLSYALGKGEGTAADNTATLVQLNGSYKVVNANGTISATPVTSVMVRNGEGLVLVKA